MCLSPSVFLPSPCFFFFYLCPVPLPDLHSFPTRRSSDLELFVGQELCGPGVAGRDLALHLARHHQMENLAQIRVARAFALAGAGPLECERSSDANLARSEEHTS